MQEQSPQSPTILGQLTEEENTLLRSIQVEHTEMLRSLGELELQKSRLIKRLDAIDDRARSMVQAVAARIGYSGDQMRVTPEGNIIAI